MSNMKNIVIVTTLLLISNAYSTTPVNETRAKYDPMELLSKIFNTTTLGRAKNGLVQFEDTLHPIRFKEFGNDEEIYQNSVKFIEDNINQNPEIKFQDVKKKRLKKRKPRQRPYPPQYLGVGSLSSYGPGPINPYFGQYYNPRPEPSLASSALNRVTEALTSIALYDDRQCVARLLCEAAGGGNLGTSGLLQAVSGLQPLLTLLSAYNGISTNPLFVFGRAVFLGMSSKGNTASCRYGYPQCPTDTEQLVHYLNNHNGGFFRFFNAPQQGQQNVEQLYNHLTQNNFNQEQNHFQQNYGLYNPNPGNQHYGFQQPNPYTINNQNYGFGYGYNENKIQKRIQNKPLSQYIDDYQDENPTWTFPNDNDNYNTISDNTDKYNDLYESSNKKGKALKFPEQNNEIVNNVNGNIRFSFPESNNYEKHYIDYLKPNNNIAYNNRYYTNNFQSYNNYNNNNNNIIDNLQTVYVVRGNGDPNRPEVVKLRPGESVH